MATPPRIALDSGALIALARGDANARALLRRWVSEGSMVLIRVPVLAETLRGGPKDAPLERVLNHDAVQFVSVSQSAAREAGHMLGASKLPTSENDGRTNRSDSPRRGCDGHRDRRFSGLSPPRRPQSKRHFTLSNG